MRFPPFLHPTRTCATATFALVAAVALGIAGPGCRRSEPPAAATAPTATVTAMPPTRSADCRGCHAAVFDSWVKSHHALAHRPVNPEADADAFGSGQEFTIHGIDYKVGWEDGKAVITEKRAGQSGIERYIAEHVLGHTPLKQYVVPIGGGRYQAAELAFDPAKKEWFSVFGEERRYPGEWGHWRGRGMNWNSMCAHCHLTAYDKNYDATSDTYASTWLEHGVGCAQCHGDLPADHMTAPTPRTPPDASAALALRRRAQETCAPCHARNELLTGEVRPGVDYADYYRLTLPTDAAVFYPDGQMRDEVFNYTSFLTSRMGGKAGVTCLDCHDPHSGKTILPASNNALCLQCHGPSPRLNAPVIDPIAHSHHATGSTGNQCISCHMPTTTYMQRDPRHDHGFVKPDPLLTKELGIPNACNRCHTDRTVDWAIQHTDTWYGEKMNSRQRERARAVAAAQTGTPGSADKLLALIQSEDIPAWRATLLQLTRNFSAGDPAVVEAARAATRDPDPIVRSAAAQVLASVPQESETLRALLEDSARLVRLDAAWALSSGLADDSRARRELDAYLAVSADQPAGRMRLGQDLFNRGRGAEAVALVRQAIQWDPNSPGIYEVLGMMLNQLGQPAEAAAALWRSAQLSPADANAAFNAALAFAGAGKLPDAELALREAVRRDPQLDRAWYNLGLLLAQTDRRAEGLSALARAGQIAPQVADYPYARATILWQQGEREAAQAAARRALEIDPQHQGARSLLQAR